MTTLSKNWIGQRKKLTARSHIQTMHATNDNLDLTSLVGHLYSLRKSAELLFLPHDFEPLVSVDTEKSTRKPSIVRSASSARRPKQVRWDDGVELKASHINGGALSRSSQQRINSAIKRAEKAAETAGANRILGEERICRL